MDRECTAMRCYKIRSRDEKIIYQPAQSDVKKRFKLSNQLQFTPSVHKMCTILKSTNCSFTFKITQSYDMNISIGICDRGDKGVGGAGAIYYTGRSGKVYENGNEVGFHFVDNLGSNKNELDYHASDHKFACYSLAGFGFQVKDIVTTEVDVEKGSIRWTVNGVVQAEYRSDYIKHMDMVPFIAMLDLYDGAYFLGI